MQTLNIVGCGSVGQTLGRLLVQSGTVQIRQVKNRSLRSTQAAIEFLGQGETLEEWDGFAHTDIVMIATDDAHIAECAQALLGRLRAGTLVFHCSGALSVTVLDELKAAGAEVASLHPVMSFANPERAVATFSGTYCGLEGDVETRKRLERLVTHMGGRSFTLRGEGKVYYHAGAVMLCNYLTALMEGGLQCYEQAGLTRQDALQINRKLIEGTLQNIFELGTARALTGPIARGDLAVVERQLAALTEVAPELAGVYRALGGVALQLAEQRVSEQQAAEEQGSASSGNLAQLRKVLGGKP